MDAIHEFGKGENKYLMSVGETKGKQVEQLVKDKKPKVSAADTRVRRGVNYDGERGMRACSKKCSGRATIGERGTRRLSVKTSVSIGQTGPFLGHLRNL